MCECSLGLFITLQSTDQDILNLIIPTFDMIQHHVLSNLLPILELVHLVVSVCVQNRPAQELGQSLRNSRKSGLDHYLLYVLLSIRRGRLSDKIQTVNLSIFLEHHMRNTVVNNSVFSAHIVKNYQIESNLYDISTGVITLPPSAAHPAHQKAFRLSCCKTWPRLLSLLFC